MTNKTYFLLVFTFLVSTFQITEIRASDKCAVSLNKLRQFDPSSDWSKATMIGIWGDADVRVDPMWQYTVKKFEKSPEVTRIQIQEDDMSTLKEFSFFMEKGKIKSLLTSNNGRFNHTYEFDKDCNIEQIIDRRTQSKIAKVKYDKSVCQRVQNMKLGQEDINKCFDVFSKIRNEISNYNKEKRSFNLEHELPEESGKTVASYSRFLSLCEQFGPESQSKNNPTQNKDPKKARTDRITK